MFLWHFLSLSTVAIRIVVLLEKRLRFRSIVFLLLLWTVTMFSGLWWWMDLDGGQHALAVMNRHVLLSVLWARLFLAPVSSNATTGEFLVSPS